MRIRLAFAAFLCAQSVSAKSPDLIDALAEGRVPSLEEALFRSGGRFVAEIEDPERARALGLVPVTRRLAVGRGRPRDLRELASLQIPLNLAPPRRTQLDVAAGHQNAKLAQSDYGLDGAGVLVGLVDTGVSVSHPDLRRSDGSTRIAWLLTFDEGPRGLQPELEALYDCETERCAIDLDRRR